MKVRLDVLLTELGLAQSRNQAQALILSGSVLVDDLPVTKAGSSVSPESLIRLKANSQRKYVGRGGDKLAAALDHFGIVLDGAVAVDVGASTGGFTDCMLKRGVSQVYAVDVGYGQLAHKLRADPRVVVLEKTHAKLLPSLNLDPKPYFATIDVSFISVRKILSFVLKAMCEPYSLLVLVKPQFELEPHLVQKGGVVRDTISQLKAVDLITDVAKGSLPLS